MEPNTGEIRRQIEESTRVKPNFSGELSLSRPHRIRFDRKLAPLENDE